MSIMRFGLFLQPVHPPSVDPTAALEADLDLVVRLDKLGYSEVWVGEHHSTGWENIAAPDVFIAAAAERTRHIRLGTGIIQAGLHHPLVTLDRMIFLDHLTRGRAMFGIGVGGGLPSDLKVFGLDQEQAGRRLDEAMDVILRLLSSTEPIDEKTDWFELHNATLQLRPYTQPHMQFAMATTNPKNIRLMGRVGGYILTGGSPSEVGGILETLEQGAAESGMTASRDQIMLSSGLHIAPTHEQAVAEIRDGLVDEQINFNAAVNGRTLASTDPDDIVATYLEHNMVGTADEVGERLESAADESGGMGGVLFVSRDWAGREASSRSWETFAREVAPRFTGSTIGQRSAAKAAGELNS